MNVSEVAEFIYSRLCRTLDAFSPEKINSSGSTGAKVTLSRKRDELIDAERNVRSHTELTAKLGLKVRE